jgi:ATP-binding cassette subfamily F protein 3
MKRVATCIVEVRDGHVTNYRGDYESYLYSVNKEIEQGERQLAIGLTRSPAAAKAPKAPPRAVRRSEKDLRKEMTVLERTIAKLDEQRKLANEQLMRSTDPTEALKLHNEVTALTQQIADAEEGWLLLQEELDK